MLACKLRDLAHADAQSRVRDEEVIVHEVSQVLREAQVGDKGL
jgi:hypothetical protein